MRARGRMGVKIVHFIEPSFRKCLSLVRISLFRAMNMQQGKKKLKMRENNGKLLTTINRIIWIDAIWSF